jgi:serine/threonine protein kinase
MAEKDKKDRAADIGDEALDLDAGPAREAFIEERSAGDPEMARQVREYIAGGDITGMEETRDLNEPPGEHSGSGSRRIDRYQVVRELGRGGMGSVYLAVRADDVYHKAVALKVVRPESGSDEVIQRFRQEREILATLEHPNIARLLDGGSTPEGLPYFVMDYVDGQPIDVYCDEHRLPIVERLKLFSNVCAAVEYAHQHGVVHRDLKPSNILVSGDGVVKLLDFGIAKLLNTGQEEPTLFVTRTGMRLMTPEYASPEQVKGEHVSTTTDVYSLGVILYELLTGHRPYRMPVRLLHEIIRVICEEEPGKPSTVVSETEERPMAGGNKTMVTPQAVSRMRQTTPAELRRSLAGDLDKILLTAMRKDPPARYASVGKFAEDLQRRLDGLPVSAQGTSLRYRAQKFMQLYKWWVIGITAVGGGMATGLIKIDPIARWVLGALVFVTGVSYLSLRQLGKRYAAANLLFASVGLVYLYALLLGPLLLLTPQFGDKYFVGRGYLSIAASAIVGWRFARHLVYWPWRERRAGPLLLDLSLRTVWRRWFLYTWGSLTEAFLIYVVVVAWQYPDRWQYPKNMVLPAVISWVFAVGSFFALAVLFGSRLEVRARGILLTGALFPWRRIRSYTWETGDKGMVLLRLNLTRFPARWSIRVPPHEKSTLSAILERQILEWPERPG